MHGAQFQALMTGHDAFDQQHRQLISLLDQLAAVQDAYQAHKLARDLIALWQQHHRSEERWMRSVDFAFEAEHRTQHQALDVFFANLGHLANSVPFLDQLPKHVELIVAKLRHHIATYDMQYRGYVPPQAARA